jgi:hypothetical protein
MAKKRLKRSRRLYSKMDKRKRKTKGKIRRKHRTKKLNKKGGGCCGSRPERDTRERYYFIDGNGKTTHELLLEDVEIPEQRRVATMGGLRLLNHDQYIQHLKDIIRNN